jgi:dihydrofolate reductase
MQRTIVIQFSTLDGIIEDPDGSQGTPSGGWAFRHGPETVAGDKFRLGATLGTGVLLLGRTTWQLFSQIWPSRTDEFSTAMNRIPKVVATHTLANLTAWPSSTNLDEDLITFVERRKADRDVIVAGSASIVHALAAADLVDEYRILLFPSVLGTGIRLFPEGSAPAHFRLVAAEPAGQAVLVCYERPTV